ESDVWAGCWTWALGFSWINGSKPAIVPFWGVRVICRGGNTPPLLRASGLLEHPDRSQDEDQQYGTADGDDEADDGATFLKAQQPGNPEAEYRADDADDDVGNQPHLLVGLHDDAGQPADNTADDQSHYPTHGPTSRCDEMYGPVKQQIRQAAGEGLPILVNAMGRQSERCNEVHIRSPHQGRPHRRGIR